MRGHIVRSRPGLDLIQFIDLGGVDTSVSTIALSGGQLANVLDGGDLFVRLGCIAKDPYFNDLDAPNGYDFGYTCYPFAATINGAEYHLRNDGPGQAWIPKVNGADSQIQLKNTVGNLYPYLRNDFIEWDYWVKTTTGKMGWRPYVNGTTFDGYSGSHYPTYPNQKPNYPVWQPGVTYAAGSVVRRWAVESWEDPWLFKTAGGLTSGGSEPAWTLSVGGTTSDNGGTWTTYQDETLGLSALTTCTAFTIGRNLAQASGSAFWGLWKYIAFYKKSRDPRLQRTALIVSGESTLKHTLASLQTNGANHVYQPGTVIAAAMAKAPLAPIVSMAYPGAGYAVMNALFDASPYKLRGLGASGFISWGHFNDVFNAPTTTETSMATAANNYFADVRSAIPGVKIIAVQLPPANGYAGGGGWNGTKETLRLAHNADLLGSGAHPIATDYTVPYFSAWSDGASPENLIDDLSIDHLHENVLGRIDAGNKVGSAANSQGIPGFTGLGQPTVTSVSPNTGAHTGGTAITITGTGFVTYGAYLACVDGIRCTSFSVVNDTTITCTTASGMTVGARSVEVRGAGVVGISATAIFTTT